MENGCVGVLGAGNIGHEILKRLVAAGAAPTVWDPVPERCEQAIRGGAAVAGSPAELVDTCTFIVLCLPTAKHVEQCVRDVLPHVSARQVFVDTSTCLPQTEILCAKLVRERGAGWVDSPLTWRPEGFVFMVGAETEHYQRVTPLLDVIGARHRLMGPVGTGQLCKLMQQTLTATEKAARLEVAAFSRAVGIDPAWLREYLGFNITARQLAEDPGTGGTLQMMYKDLGYFLQVAHEQRGITPVAALVHEIFKSTLSLSDGTWSHDAIHAYWRHQRALAEAKPASPDRDADNPSAAREGGTLA
jgi:3-hydroxyisobutyrate dehydrogenase-like beta-hydroxyacid dehydrogenase